MKITRFDTEEWKCHSSYGILSYFDSFKSREEWKQCEKRYLSHQVGWEKEIIVNSQYVSIKNLSRESRVSIIS